MSLSSLLNDPKHWQDRAAQAEALAQQMTDVVGKATALSIAEDYGRLGRRAEDRALVRLNNPTIGEPVGRLAVTVPQTGEPARSGGPSLPGRLIMPMTWLVVSAIVGIVAFLIAWSYHDAGDKARHTAENVARALEGDIARNVDLYGSALQRLTDVLENPAVVGLAPDLRNLLVFSLAGRSPDLGPIRIADPQGNIVADSDSGRPREENIADRDYFRVHREQQGVGLYISLPFKDGPAHAADSIALSRKVSDRDGAFAGVVSAVLRLGYLRTLFQHIDIGPHGVITFLSTDGTVLVRQPSLSAGGDAGLRISGGWNFARMLKEKNGSFAARYSADGVNRMRAFRQIGSLPLMIVVGLALDDVYAEWWRRAT
jgi:hypothetical protein